MAPETATATDPKYPCFKFRSDGLDKNNQPVVVSQKFADAEEFANECERNPYDWFNNPALKDEKDSTPLEIEQDLIAEVEELKDRVKNQDVVIRGLNEQSQSLIQQVRAAQELQSRYDALNEDKIMSDRSLVTATGQLDQQKKELADLNVKLATATKVIKDKGYKEPAA